MCQPCSSFADTIAPTAESSSNRTAVPFVSRFCSTTRVSLSPWRCPLRTAPAFFPGLKFSPTLGSGTQSALHDDTHALHNARKFGSDPRPPAPARPCTIFPSPPPSALEPPPPPLQSSGQMPEALLPWAGAACP